MCGNPTKITGFFYDSHHKSRELYNAMHIDGRDSSRVDQQFIDTIIDMFGEDSDVFRVRVAGEFPKALPDSFIPMEWAERASEAEAPEIDRAAVLTSGLTSPRYGDDSSVLSPGPGQEAPGKAGDIPPQRHHGAERQGRPAHPSAMPWSSPGQRYTSKSTVTAWALASLTASMELREQIVEEVQAQRDRRYADDEDAPPPFSLDIVECHFGGEGGTISDDDPIDYQNSTGLMWGAVREALRTQSIKLYPDDKQISQLSNRKYVVNSAGKIELEKKEAMKKRGLSSPDMGDALALALHDPLVSDWSID